MRAIGFSKNLSVDNDDVFEVIDLPEPVAKERELLVEIEAVSVNPADAKLRQVLPPLEQGHHVLGFDAVGRVLSTGPGVAELQPGDLVWYAGALGRQGSNAEMQVVDERIASKAPTNITAEEAAALPLTSITAWEIIFDRFGLTHRGGEGKTLLIIGGAGGVGSIPIQLARHFTNLTVIATASRPKTRKWVKEMGAHHIINHARDMKAQLERKKIKVDLIAGLTASETHFPAYADIIEPQGKLVLIDDPDAQKIDISLLKTKSVALIWEFMFTRPMFSTSDMHKQGIYLGQTAAMIEDGTLKTTATKNLGPLTVGTLRKAHAIAESGKAVGKTVLGKPQI
ncbi:oxidoreductase [Tateyamaria omphalii]|uniref:zinc-binding alcohol dehydrogenase family protein n=1 Tax=Tateyamaria omphalii TaxID=299262 RepID=UPI00167AAD1C|nr:zinc-binding alcohol dehydrogenase family protein [Tateyamaria omphalii]GGX71198.1 oxidoreductase [Tateyamaria omphalii]